VETVTRDYDARIIMGHPELHIHHRGVPLLVWICQRTPNKGGWKNGGFLLQPREDVRRRRKSMENGAAERTGIQQNLRLKKHRRSHTKREEGIWLFTVAINAKVSI